MERPQDLPDEFGVVVAAIDAVLASTGTKAVLAGGWAVWRHGYAARVTEDVDVAIATADVEKFLTAAATADFNLIPGVPGRWPKLRHRASGVRVDILPEGETPGAERLAPTKIPSPEALGATGTTLGYISLTGLIELKIAAGRSKDETDVIELIRANIDRVAAIRSHLAGVHPSYVDAFNGLVRRAAFDDSK